jgi:hypothetical protein
VGGVAVGIEITVLDSEAVLEPFSRDTTISSPFESMMDDLDGDLPALRRVEGAADGRIVRPGCRSLPNDAAKALKSGG